MTLVRNALCNRQNNTHSSINSRSTYRLFRSWTENEFLPIPDVNISLFYSWPTQELVDGDIHCGNQRESVKSFSDVASLYDKVYLLMSSEYSGIPVLCFVWALSRMLWIELIPFQFDGKLSIQFWYCFELQSWHTKLCILTVKQI